MRGLGKGCEGGREDKELTECEKRGVMVGGELNEGRGQG